MTEPVTSIEAVLSRGPLSRFPRELARSWLKAGVRLEAPAGSFIYHEHSDPRAGVVVEGLVRMFMAAPDGRQVTVRYARPGQLVGIPAVMGGPAPVSAQMLTPTVLVMLPVDALERAARTNAEVACLFAEEICHRLYDALEGLAGNAFGSLKERVCRHLLELAAVAQRDERLVVGTTQQELANAVGSTRVAVARILSELRESGIVDTGADGIVLLEPIRIHEEAWVRE